MNKTRLLFETTAELRAFLKKRRIGNYKIDAIDVTLTAVLNEKDIAVACKDYHARVIERPSHI